MPPVTNVETGQAYWRSLEELADTPEFRAFLEAEFPGLAPEALSSPSRRQFLRLMGASMALAGMTGCRWPEQKIAPYTSRPAGRTPGVAVQYATAMDLGGAAQGLLVTSYDGRPIKIEGNPSHALNCGAADAVAQASVLELYDPDRSKACRRRDNGQAAERTWEDFEAFAKEHFGALRERGGAGLAVLTESSSSPSLADMRRRFREAFPQAKWYEYEPISRDNERRGTALVFGTPHRPHLALDHAHVIVSLDADLLGGHPAALKHIRDFVAARDIDEQGNRRDNGGPMCRLYAIESTYTITGAMADQRWAVPSSSVVGVACQLAGGLQGMGLALPDALNAALEDRGGTVLDQQAVASMAQDLFGSRRHCIIAAGERQPPEVHALVHALNVALENGGHTIGYSDEPDPDRPACVDAIRSLSTEMREGEVDTLLILGGNPVYDAPDDVAFADGLTKVPTSIHLSLHENETSRGCAWHLPRAHYLESWGDARAYDGTLSIVQPLIEPLWGGRTPIEALGMILGGEPTRGYDIVRRTLEGLAGVADFEAFWRQCLHDGIVADTEWPTDTPAPNVGAWADRLADLAAEGVQANPERFEVVFTPDVRLYDGRFANNGWLQEMPEPITKLTWDNAALIAPATAEWLGIRRGDLLTLEVNGRQIEIAAFVQPGQAPGSIAIPLGFGRRAAGHVGAEVGFDAYALRTTEAMYVARSAKITRTGRRYQLATTQDHQAMDSAIGRKEGRQRVGRLVREATVDEFRHHPDFAQHEVHHLPLVSLWTEHDYEGRRRWAMAIDLNRCVGCGASARGIAPTTARTRSAASTGSTTTRP